MSDLVTATLHQFDWAYFLPNILSNSISEQLICKISTPITNSALIIVVMTFLIFFNFAFQLKLGWTTRYRLFQWSPPTFLIPLQRRNARINTGPWDDYRITQNSLNLNSPLTLTHTKISTLISVWTNPIASFIFVEGSIAKINTRSYFVPARFYWGIRRKISLIV